MTARVASRGVLALGLVLPVLPDLASAWGGTDGPRVSTGAKPPARSASRDARADKTQRKANGSDRRRAMRRRKRASARWHRHASRGRVRTWMRKEPSPLVLRPLHMDDAFALEPHGEEGGFDGKAMNKARRALADDDGKDHRIHPRLLDVVYDAARRFRAPYVTIISGYRDGRSTSRHTHGRAVDLVLPGVRDRRLASHLTRQGFVGVGLYPRSGFVHLDVRHRSYFWVDYSGPGQRQRPRQVFRQRARVMDRRAAREGVQRVEPLQGAEQVESEGG